MQNGRKAFRRNKNSIVYIVNAVFLQNAYCDQYEILSKGSCFRDDQ